MRICPEGKQRYKLLISYDGTDTVGWQRQGHDRTAIQETLEELLGRLYATKITLVGSSRTDAGVHADGQVAHFDAIPDPARTARLFKALNRLCPRHIAVKAIWEVPPEFHAIHSTLKKTYKYRVFNAPYRSSMFGRYTEWVHRPLDIEYLNECCQYILGEHDFISFQTGPNERKTSIRRILSAHWERRTPHLVEFTITGSGFLKQMVRNLVGTMLDLHKYGKPPSDLQKVVEARDRRVAGATAAARGLTLYRIYYPQHLDFKSHKI
ncbi:MAG TPA: tRNA pseudouridine(38-40) synthase TruA [Bdellovibrionales bacterium]|nr:tRNA pseudouridine(38-40) synthase TruA [Bdellovibrionales bacterium]